MTKHPALLVLAAAALPLAACSSAPAPAQTATQTTTATQTASATATRTTTSTATATQTATATASATSSVTQSAVAAAPAGASAVVEGCLAKNLELTTADAADGEAGARRYQLTVKNIGGFACSMKDPKITWVSGPEYVEPVGHEGEYSSGQAGAVTIPSGGAATTHFYVAGARDRSCQEKDAFALGLWAADGKAAVAPFKHTVCDGSPYADLGVDHFQLA